MVITAQNTRLKPGYKQTEVGIVPEDWEVRTLGQLGELKNGINKGKTDFGHGFPFVNLLDVFGVIKVSNDSGFGLVNSTDNLVLETGSLQIARLVPIPTSIRMR